MRNQAFALLALAAIVSGCNSMVSSPSPVSADTQFMGFPAQGLTLKVDLSINWIYTSDSSYEEMVRVPSGRYTVVGIDRQFIYFKGSGKVSYSMRTGIRSTDVDRRKGPGGIYFRRKKKSKMFSNVGAWIQLPNGKAERVLAGYDSFLKEKGQSWKLIPKKTP